MTAVSAPDGSDFVGVARGCEPVVDRGADPPALHRRVARAMVTGDQEDDALTAADRLLETALDCGPG
jgi:hypothetical protein